jgi:hypothetical protein
MSAFPTSGSSYEIRSRAGNFCYRIGQGPSSAGGWDEERLNGFITTNLLPLTDKKQYQFTSKVSSHGDKTFSKKNRQHAKVEDEFPKTFIPTAAGNKLQALEPKGVSCKPSVQRTDMLEPRK